MKSIGTQLMEDFMQTAHKAVDLSLDGIKQEAGYANLNPLLYSERKGTSILVIVETPVWDYLSSGTGIYNPEHAGAGPHGEIVPLTSFSLHFKNAQLAQILGFKGSDVFLKSVKGIPGKYYFERYLEMSRFEENLANAAIAF